MKFWYSGAGAVGLLVLAAWTAFVFERRLTLIWQPALVSLLLLWPFARWIRIRTTLTVLAADRLRSETGVLSKSTRNLMLSRIQDVGVQQSLGQRVLNVGDVWIETAGVFLIVRGPIVQGSLLQGSA